MAADCINNQNNSAALEGEVTERGGGGGGYSLDFFLAKLSLKDSGREVGKSTQRRTVRCIMGRGRPFSLFQ